jgi:leader peptidase (prepilin peptidase)/N-methyltransferase
VIPNKVLLVAAVAGVAIATVGDPSSLPERAIAAAAAGGGLFLVALAYPQGMGLGDVKLAAVMGLYLGRNVAPALLVALLAGSVVGLALIARHGAEARKRAIPFGPFLALGGVVALLAGNQLVDWYLSTF